MNRYLSIVLLVSATTVGVTFTHGQGSHGGGHQPGTDSSSVNAGEFRQLAEQWKDAYNSGDAKNLIPLYARDADYISAHVAGYIAHGLDRVIANFQKGIDIGGSLDSIEILSIRSSCDLATVVTRYTGLSGGKKVDGRNLLVCKRIHGKWLIVTHMTAVKEQ